MLKTSSNYSNLNSHDYQANLVKNRGLKDSRASENSTKIVAEASVTREGLKTSDAEVQTKALIGQSLIKTPFVEQPYRSISEALKESLRVYSQENNKVVDYQLVNDANKKNMKETLKKVQELYPGIHLDFSNTDLSSMKITVGNFENANFRGANLDNVILRRFNFKGADFENASLKGAHIARSHFDRASFRKADLRGAKILDPKFKITNFRDANLEGLEQYIWRYF